MIKITRENAGEVVVSGKWSISASVKPEQGSKEQKQVTLEFLLEDIPFTDIMASSLKDKRINWQVKARNNFNSLKDKGVVTVDYKGGRQPVDIEEAFAARLNAMTPEAREAKIQELMAKAQKK